MTLFWLITDFLQQLASKNTWPWPLFHKLSSKICDDLFLLIAYFFQGDAFPLSKKWRVVPPSLRPNTPCLPCNTYTWWPFFVFWLIADFSRGNASPLLSQKSEWSSSLHIPAPIHPACHAIPILDDPFCCFCSSPIFPGRTRSLSQKSEESSSLHVPAPIHPCLPCNRTFSNRTFIKLRAEFVTFSPGATWSHYATAPIFDLTTPLHQYLISLRHCTNILRMLFINDRKV